MYLEKSSNFDNLDMSSIPKLRPILIGIFNNIAVDILKYLTIFCYLCFLIYCIFFSRTDSGVHATFSTLVVDLAKREDDPGPHPCFDPHLITQRVNGFFIQAQLPIRVLKTVAVPNSFLVRKCVQARTYQYKIAVVKDLKGNYY